MKRLVLLVSVSLMLGTAALAQATSAGSTSQTPSAEKPKRVIFRATKDQIKEVQTKLKAASTYSGEASGKLDNATRASIKTFQSGNGLKQTGTLNRATLEKMGIELTETQKATPVSESSYASADAEKKPKTAATAATSETKSNKPKIFRATKDQINAAQQKLKAGNMYGGEQTGKLDDATRDGLKKFQEENKLKVTGTLNQVTLEKMGIGLTDKQKADAEANK